MSRPTDALMACLLVSPLALAGFSGWPATDSPAGFAPPAPAFFPEPDWMPPELAFSFGEDRELDVRAMDNADPEPDLVTIISRNRRGNRIEERWFVRAEDGAGNAVTADLEVRKDFRRGEPLPQLTDVRLLALAYRGTPPERLPEHSLRANWDSGGALHQRLRVAGALTAEVSRVEDESLVRVRVPGEGRAIEVAEAGTVTLEMMTDRGGFAMNTLPSPAGAEDYVGVDWEKLLASGGSRRHGSRGSVSVGPLSHATPGSSDTSEFLLGNVYVDVILLESNGTLDPNLENWTATQRTTIMTEVNQTRTFWRNQAQASNYPLSFTVDFSRVIAPLATAYEPIRRCGPQTSGCTTFDDAWITEAMAQLGYTGATSTTQKMRSYLNARRTATGADWAFLAFVINSDRDADGNFSNNFSAYGKWLGGPAVIMTWNNGAWGSGRMDQVFAHELAHMFYALDEYSGGFGCTATSNVNTMTGYLNVNNPNCEILTNPNPPPPTNPNPNACNCLMRNNNLVLSAGTRNQIGWRDQNASGVPDILDALPASTLLGPGSTSPHFLVQYQGNLQVTPLSNQNPWNPAGNDATLTWIVSAQARLDGGPWTALTAADGTFNGHHESVAFPLFLQPGNHTVRLRTRNAIPRFTTPLSSAWGAESIDTLQVLGTRSSVDALLNATTWDTRSRVASDGNYVYVAFDRGIPVETFLVRSSDAGRNWSAATPVSPLDGNPSMMPAVAARGSTVLVAYMNWNSPAAFRFEVMMRRSTDRGASFSPEMNVTRGMRPELAITSTEAHLVYSLGRVVYRRSTDGGASWSAPVNLTGTGASNPALAANGNEVHVAYRDTNASGVDIYYRRSGDGGATWGAPVRISGNPTGQFASRSEASLAVSGSAVNLLWMDKQLVGGATVVALMHARSTDGGITWSTETRLEGSGLAGANAIASSGADVHVVWQDTRNATGNKTNLYYRRSGDGGLTWTGEVLLQGTASLAPDLAASGTSVHLVWADQRPAARGLYYRYLQ